MSPLFGRLAGRAAQAWPWAAAAASGALLALCYPPFSFGGLAWVALAPLLAALWFSQEAARREWLRVLGLGWVFGLVFFVSSLAWLRTVTLPGWILLSLYLAIYPGLWAWFTARVARPLPKAGDDRPPWSSPWSNLRAAALVAAAWVVAEWLRGWVFTGFGWNGLAVALVDNLPMIQIADITGAAGVGFLVVLVNAVAVITLARLRREIAAGRMRPHYEFGLAVLAVAGAFTYGARKVLEPPPASIEVTFAGVQANIPIEERRDPARDSDILETHQRMSRNAILMKPDLLIWPEAATPNPLFSDRKSWETVRGLASGFDGDFLLGSVHYEEAGDFNSAILLTRGGAEAQIYHKMHLVPFGEYVPLRRAFPLFAWVVGGLVPGDFDAGRHPVLLEMAAKPVRLGVLICFEDTLAYISRQFALEGAQMLVTLTNDAWFLRSSASEQHRANAALRTVETRLPLVRVANTGVTCAIDHVGRETHRLEQPDGNTFFEGVLFGKVNALASPVPTFYTKHGDWWVVVCAGVAGLAILIRRLRK